MSVSVQSMVGLRCEICGANSFTLLLAPQVAGRHYARRRAFLAGIEALANGTHPVPERAIFTQRYTASLVACRLCGVVMRSPQPAVDAVASAYLCDGNDPANHAAMHVAEFEQCKRLTLRLARALPCAAKIVEIGPSLGGFLARARTAGWDAIGLSATGSSAAFCSGRGLRCSEHCIGCAPIADRSIDCVIALGTFDRIRDPGPTLVAAERVLKTGGLIVIRVPNGACYQRHLDSIFEAEADGDHRRAEMFRRLLLWNDLYGFPYLWGYSVDSLDALMHQRGFERIAVRGSVLPAMSTAACAATAIDERWLKALQSASVRLQMLRREGTQLAPWLEITYRLA